jgi:hypothetical protein
MFLFLFSVLLSYPPDNPTFTVFRPTARSQHGGVLLIFKPNAALGDVVGVLRALSKDLTKEDHVIIVEGPDNSLERDLNYQTEKDLDNTAKNSRHTNVEFVRLLGQHDQPHMNRWVRSVNMRLEHALWTADKSHIRLIDVPSFNMYNHTRHGLIPHPLASMSNLWIYGLECVCMCMCVCVCVHVCMYAP